MAGRKGSVETREAEMESAAGRLADPPSDRAERLLGVAEFLSTNPLHRKRRDRRQADVDLESTDAFIEDKVGLVRRLRDAQAAIAHELARLLRGGTVQRAFTLADKMEQLEVTIQHQERLVGNAVVNNVENEEQTRVKKTTHQ